MTDGAAQETVRARLAHGLDRGVRALAIALTASVGYAAWHDVSQGYDVWYYHLPFAARLAGIMDAQAYAFSADNQARYEGFPLFAEAVQGLVWRVSGHVAATNLVSLAGLFALMGLLYEGFGVRLHLSLLAFLAVPLVHIHATASYIDLPANACATMLLLFVHRVLASGEAPTPKVLGWAAALATMTASSKFQLVPIVGCAALVLVVTSVWWPLREAGPRTGEWRTLFRRRLLVFAIALPIVFATPIKNAVVHGNPVWPVALNVLGHSFPHVEEAYSQSPPQLANASRPTRFVRSVLEIDNLPISTGRRWSLDQWAPPSDPSCRMGGYFGAYVVVNLVALAVALVRRRSREAIAAAALFGGVTVVAALVPQSHELRYYMHWMLLLVSLNLILWAKEARLAVGAVAVAALAVVAWSTSGGYLYASGMPFSRFLEKRSDPSAIEAATTGERLCIAREPFTFLYAPVFHPGHDYSVQEATKDADCKGARKLP